jgi:hypothetical protein
MGEIIKSELNTNFTGLQLNKIFVNQEYLNEWNANSYSDFVCLTFNGELLRPTLYRVGGLNNPNLNKDKYFLLLKYIEHKYDLDFIKKCYPEKSRKEQELQRKTLVGVWCVLDYNGNEKIIFDQFQTPYLKNDSCIYSVDNKYYNIETGEFYGSSYSSLESKDFLFLKDYEKGILKINKKDGSYELFQ